MSATTTLQPVGSGKPLAPLGREPFRGEPRGAATTSATMTKSEFVSWAREQKAERIARGKAEAEARYSLLLIGHNPNDPTSYAVVNPEGIVYRIEGHETIVHGHFVGNLLIELPKRELCPDTIRCNAINKRLESLGADFWIESKHRTIRMVLFCAMPEVM